MKRLSDNMLIAWCVGTICSTAIVISSHAQGHDGNLSLGVIVLVMSGGWLVTALKKTLQGNTDYK